MATKSYPAIVEVFWLDSVLLERGEWMDIEDFKVNKEQLLHRSVGYLVAESEVAIGLASSIDDQLEDKPVDRVMGAIVIPRCAIENMNVFREAIDDDEIKWPVP